MFRRSAGVSVLRWISRGVFRTTCEEHELAARSIRCIVYVLHEVAVCDELRLNLITLAKSQRGCGR